MKVAIRRIENLQGIVLPKPVRIGWADAARRLADCADDVLVIGEFANEGDAEREWSGAAMTVE